MQDQRSGRWRYLAAVSAVVAAVGSATVLPAPLAGATPGRVVRPGAPRTAPHPAALPALPAGSAYARQILRALHPDDAAPTNAAIARVGRLLDVHDPSFVVAAELVGSAWLDPRLEAEYQRYLGRSIDPSGLGHWRSVVSREVGRSGRADVELAIVNVAASNEAWRRSGETAAGFVDRTYAKVLGRAADPGGRAYWTSRLQAGTSRQALVRSLLRSNERATRLVGDAFVQYLGRGADPGGRASWVGRYRTAKVGELSLIVNLLGSPEARSSGCDPLDPRLCLLPFPNDHFTVADPSTATGRRVSLKREWLPANKDGVRANPQEHNRNDGFSVGQAALLKVPGLDLTQTGAAPITDIEASLDPDAPIVVIDADTGAHHPVFAELDANIPAAAQAADQLLFIRPAVNYSAGHRYIVALRNLKRGDGSTIAAPASFTFYRDPAGIGLGAAEARRPHMEQIFSELEGAGVGRDDLYLAWDFTVASTENTTGRLLHIRDDALATLGGSAPSFTVTSVTADPAAGVARRVEGTFQVPLYLKGDGSPGNAFNNGADGLPVRNGSFAAAFDCELPTLAVGDKARSVIYGHGLFGDRGEVRSGPQRAMVRDHDMAYCATDWIGMSEADIGNAATILSEVSTFPSLTDRSQQGIVNTVFLDRLLVTADGFVSDPAFQTPGGLPLLDTSDLFYDGNSQGGVIGGAFVAVAPDVSAGVLGVAGMNYSTLLERSVDFDPFFAIMQNTYPRAVDRVLGLQLIQMLWDRGETNGYAAHLTTNPLPGSGANRVLIHVALGDHQVAPFTAEIEARTAGDVFAHRPAYGPGRTADVEPFWGLSSTEDGSRQSALVVWDSGAVLAPTANVAPRAGPDPHQDPRESALGQQQKSAFLRTDGTFTDVCGSDPCTAPAT